MPICPVPNCYGAHLSLPNCAMPNCPGAQLSWCPIVLGPNCPGAHLFWCPFVRCSFVRCPLVLVPNCPGVHLSKCPFVSVPICLVPVLSVNRTEKKFRTISSRLWLNGHWNCGRKCYYRAWFFLQRGDFGLQRVNCNNSWAWGAILPFRGTILELPILLTTEQMIMVKRNECSNIFNDLPNLKIFFSFLFLVFTCLQWKK